MRHRLSLCRIFLLKNKNKNSGKYIGGNHHDRRTQTWRGSSKARAAHRLAQGSGPDHPHFRGRIPDRARPRRRHDPRGHGPDRQPRHRRQRQARDRALQVLQPQVPPGGHRRRGRRREDRRRQLRHDRRPVLRRVRGADCRGRKGRQGLRREHPARRRVQAPHLALRLSGPEGHRHRAAQNGARGHRPADRDGDHGR